MFKLINYLIYPLLTLLLLVVNVFSQCNLILNEQPKWLPLIWKNPNNLIYPIKNSSGIWIISIGKQKNINFGCTPSTNFLQMFKLQEIQLECSKYSKLKGPNNKIISNFTELSCSGIIKENIVIQIRKNILICANGLKSIEIRHEPSTTTILPLINLCYNQEMYMTIIVKHTIQGKSLNPFEISNVRPNFKSGQFYSKFSVGTAYSQSQQLKTMTILVGSNSLAAKYINVSKSFYFSRGHLAPDGDFVHVYEQNATYYYVNVVPQWQSINNGNLKELEIATRNYAIRKQIDLHIWTGSYGILELNDTNGNLVQIFLGKNNVNNKILPVPRILIKIIYDKIQKSGLAVLILNNPHITSINSNDIICPNICEQIKWITWTKENFHKGYTYCCKVNELKKIYHHIPNFKNVSILI